MNGLRRAMTREREWQLKQDRLLVAALIEARSCERFSRLLEVVEDADLRALFGDLGPAEERHCRVLHGLAARGRDRRRFARRWRRWLERERDLCRGLGIAPTVHG